MRRSKRILGITGLIASSALTLGLVGCSGGGDGDNGGDGGGGAGGGEIIDIGFVAVGPEGGWREANETNIRETFTEDLGFNLKYAPATNLDQNSQIDAFTSFVDEGVDVILLSATEATGWEQSLQRAQEAEIPVILLDRGIEPDDTDLYVTRIAPDNATVAEAVGEWAVSEFPDGANYIVLEGPAGVGVVNERNAGWNAAVEGSSLTGLASQTANWSTQEGKSVTETLLRSHNNDIQIIFAQNDEMGLGAAQAVEEAGLTPGEDVYIATIDGTLPALEALAEGRLSFVHEYNPLFGEQALEAVNAAINGDAIDSYVLVPSQAFDSPEAAETALPDRQF